MTGSNTFDAVKAKEGIRNTIDIVKVTDISIPRFTRPTLAGAEKQVTEIVKKNISDKYLCDLVFIILRKKERRKNRFHIER